jgi:hypothetical protein
MLSTNPIVRIKRSDIPGQLPAIEQLMLGELALNIPDAELYTLRSRSGFSDDLVKLGAGANVTNVLYVNQDGKDTNTGKKLGDAKRTIAGAVSAATEGTIIKVSAGNYVENNPISLPNGISIVGDSLREVSITPQNQSDLFYVGSGNYISNMSFVGSANTGAIVSFDPISHRYITQSPYVQNCTNFIPNSIGMKIDGSVALGSLKSMVLDSYTQYNQGGIGVSITNEGYAQLVSLFTICNNIAVYCGSGGACDLTNSNSSFGNYGLIADGIGGLKYTGTIFSEVKENSDTVTIQLVPVSYMVYDAQYTNTTGIATITTMFPHQFKEGMDVVLTGLLFTCADKPEEGIKIYPSGENKIFNVLSVPQNNQIVLNVGISTTPNQTYVGGGVVVQYMNRPFDGLSVYLDKLYFSVEEITITNNGSGYINNPIIVIDPPETSWGVQAQAVAQVINGEITSIEIISSGRGYTKIPNITISSPDVGINTATAYVSTLPNYYTVKSSTPISSGICTVTFNDNIPYSIGIGSTVPFFKQSRILASGHSFEYIGSGVTISNALPSTGGVPIQSNETVSKNGGLVVYTSTDQSGNFRIGDGVTINQSTGTISGTFYSKSLFSTITPFILALGGD